jgi:hypothetical protein
MARPETTRDIDVKAVEFGNINFNQIATDPALLKGYTAFIEAVAKAGATVEMHPYSGAQFSRPASQAEALAQLQSAQDRWDEGERNYETLRTVGDVEYNWQRNQAQSWAEAENLPWPPDVEESLPTPSVEDTIESINEVLA